MERERRVIALGFFDGIHVGHQALFRKTRGRALQLGATPSVISFDEHPEK
ncbi:MAG: riboflavin biosynthesis protein RibF, partial [Oscillospiraceae bacterium]|nr:riboflavin biosynthesis protein RibF [Oscillospiraceae bacterium]